MDKQNGRDNSPPEEEKPIIDQMTDLAAQAAGTLAETAVKAGAKKAKKAVARRLPGPVKKAATTIARAAKGGARKSRATKARATKTRATKTRATKNPDLRKLGLRQKRQSRKPPKSLRRDQQKPVDQGLNVAPSARKRPPEVLRKRPGGGDAPDRQLDCRRIAPPMCPAFVGGVGSGAKAIGRTPSTPASSKEGKRQGQASDRHFTITMATAQVLHEPACRRSRDFD